MQNLLNDIWRRFPLLKSLKLVSNDGAAEGLPTFVGLLLATIEQARERALCFVFPRKGDIAALTAVVHSLGRFASEFPKLAENYARRSFQKGQRVKLRPGDKVFVFGGLWETDPRQFRLEIIDRDGSAFTWPTSEILRIEPTHRKIPHGQFLDADRLRHDIQLSDLDRLVGTRTFGNASLFETYAFYAGRQSAFQEFLVNTRLTTDNFDSAPPLARFVATGSITQVGTIEHADPYNPQGQPFIAVDSRLEHIAAACASAPLRTISVIVDGAHEINDLGKFDQICERQNILIFAEETEDDKIHQLHERGCKIWRVSAGDLGIGRETERGSFFGPLYKAADNEARLAIDSVNCENTHLENVSLALEACDKALDEAEGDETRRLLGVIYSLLMHCGGLLQPPDSEQREILRQRVSSVAGAAKDRMTWLNNAAAQALTDACEQLTATVEDNGLGNAKANALADCISKLRESRASSCGLVARSLAQQADASSWVTKHEFSYPVLLPWNLAGAGFLDAVICLSWPNSVRFERLVSQYAAPSIHVVAYPFERRWLDQFRRRLAANRKTPSIGPSEKSCLVGFSSDLAFSWTESQKSPMPESPATPSELPKFQIWKFEQKIAPKGLSAPAMEGEEMVPTTFVTFVGDAYCFLTATCKLPVVTELVSGRAGDSYAIPRCRLEDIHVDDVLVFREGGRRDVIQALADSALGSNAAKIRSIAAEWQRALRESQLSETEVMQALARVGCNRRRQVVRYWLEDGSIIGPQNESDITAIAQATGDESLRRDASRVWQVIRTLRSAHHSAGMRLLTVLLHELPRRVGELRHGGSHIEIENAIGAWIVQVESIAERPEPRPRSQINTLLWGPESLF